MVCGDLAGWHWQTLSLAQSSSPGLSGCITPVGHRAPLLPSSSPNPKLWIILSPLSAQQAEPSPSQDSAPEAFGFSLVPGGCPQWLHHREPTPKMGSSTWRDWRTLALQEHQALFKSQSFMFSLPTLLRYNMMSLPMSLTGPRATEVKRVCNSATTVCCCPEKRVHWRISTKVLENTKNWPVQSY